MGSIDLCFWNQVVSRKFLRQDAKCIGRCSRLDQSRSARNKPGAKDVIRLGRGIHSFEQPIVFKTHEKTVRDKKFFDDCNFIGKIRINKRVVGPIIA